MNTTAKSVAPVTAAAAPVVTTVAKTLAPVTRTVAPVVVPVVKTVAPGDPHRGPGQHDHRPAAVAREEQGQPPGRWRAQRPSGAPVHGQADRRYLGQGGAEGQLRGAPRSLGRRDQARDPADGQRPRPPPHAHRDHPDPADTDSADAGADFADADFTEPEALPVLPDPVPRDAERALARFGLLGEGAAPAFTPGARYPLAGLLDCARQVYGRLRDGFYGLEVVLVVLVFMALLREARAEGATRIPPAALGRVLGLDRAPEVKTIRKLAGLAAAGKAGELQLALARHHAAASPETLGFLYIDGHTRAYFGKRDLHKMHVSRLKFPGPATEETRVTGSAGDPLLVVMAQPSSSLAAQIRDLLPALRDIAGPGARPVLCFDRGGWSPALFADIADAGFDLLTYRKNDAGKDIPDLPEDAFSAVGCTGDDGREHACDLADTTTDLTISEGEHKGRVLSLRQVTRRKPGDARQAHILTTRPAAALPAAAAVATARKTLAAAEADRQDKLAALHSPAPGTSVVITNTTLARLDAPVTAARRDLAAAQAAARAIRAKIPLGEHNPAMVKLDTETKLITHAIRMAACNTETILARALIGRYARAGDEAYALIREALHTSGDITIRGSALHIRLDPLSAPRRTRALAALCEQLSTTATRYPGTRLLLRYEVKEHPGTT